MIYRMVKIAQSGNKSKMNASALCFKHKNPATQSNNTGEGVDRNEVSGSDA